MWPRVAAYTLGLKEVEAFLVNEGCTTVLLGRHRCQHNSAFNAQGDVLIMFLLKAASEEQTDASCKRPLCMKIHVLRHDSLKNKQCVRNTQLTFSQLGDGEEEETVQ